MAAAIQPKKGRPKAVINPDSCTGCEVCIAVCPVDCIDKLPGPEHPTMNAVCVIDQPPCIGCFLCEKICPWDAITMVPPQEAPATEAGTTAEGGGRRGSPESEARGTI